MLLQLGSFLFLQQSKYFNQFIKPLCFVELPFNPTSRLAWTIATAKVTKNKNQISNLITILWISPQYSKLKSIIKKWLKHVINVHFLVSINSLNLLTIVVAFYRMVKKWLVIQWRLVKKHFCMLGFLW